MQKMPEMQVRSLGREDTLEEEMATHSCILAWETPWTEEPGGLQSLGSRRVWHDWAHMHISLISLKGVHYCVIKLIIVVFYYHRSGRSSLLSTYYLQQIQMWAVSHLLREFYENVLLPLFKSMLFFTSSVKVRKMTSHKLLF